MISLARNGNKFSICKRMYSFSKSHKYAGKMLYPLRNRGLIKVKGPEAAKFLQGLITNDMSNLKEGATSMYALFLNNKGKVLYDTLIHKWGGVTDNAFMLECDKGIQLLLEIHLDMYKSKHNIQIEDVSELYKCWALIAPQKCMYSIETIDELDINIFKDPRLADLGYRLITTPEMSQLSIRGVVGNDTVTENDEQEYRAMRYKLGVSEGAEDMYPGTCCPLELNCDYLHGLSLKKSNYTGHEFITACIKRGGARERIMPIHLLSSEVGKNEGLEKDAKIWANIDCGKINVGKLTNFVGSIGLGLVKIEAALEAKTLHIGSNPIVISQPDWWPTKKLKEQ